jgi:hypothetical protein
LIAGRNTPRWPLRSGRRSPATSHGSRHRLVHLDADGQSERVVDAIRATAADTEKDIADMTANEAMTRRALDLLGSKRNDAYEAHLAALRDDTQGWWNDELARAPDELGECEDPVTADVTAPIP